MRRSHDRIGKLQVTYFTFPLYTIARRYLECNKQGKIGTQQKKKIGTQKITKTTNYSLHSIIYSIDLGLAGADLMDLKL